MKVHIDEKKWDRRVLTRGNKAKPKKANRNEFAAIERGKQKSVSEKSYREKAQEIQ